MESKIIEISTGFLSGNLFCGADMGGIDEHASTCEFARLLKAKIETEYHGVEVSVDWQDAEGCRPSNLRTYAMFDGDSTWEQSDEIEITVDAIQEDIFESGDWCVNTPLRQQVATKLKAEITEALRKQHEANYESLYADSDGDVWWSEEIDQNTFRANTERLIQVGCGSTPCNCDWCQGDDAVGRPDEIEFEVEECDEMDRRLGDAFDNIEAGYFEDEDQPMPLTASAVG